MGDALELPNNTNVLTQVSILASESCPTRLLLLMGRGGKDGREEEGKKRGMTESPNEQESCTFLLGRGRREGISASRKQKAWRKDEKKRISK